jgi:hypothetical protein
MTLHILLMSTMVGAQVAGQLRRLIESDSSDQFSSMAEMQDFSTVEGAHQAKSSSTSSITRRKQPQSLDWTDQQDRQGGVPTKHLHDSPSSKFAHPRYATEIINLLLYDHVDI